MGVSLRVRSSIGCAAFLCLAAAHAAPPSIHTTKRPSVASPWEQAERQRAALEAQPIETRTKAAYAHVLDAFRAIYHDNPRDAHAADAINAVAELLAAQGEDLDDQKSLRAAVGQYEFLRAQYPMSSLRGSALLAEARIEAHDLDDSKVAAEKLRELLQESPRGETARQARAELAGLQHSATGDRLGKAVLPTHHDEAVMDGALGLALPVKKRETSLAQVTGIRHWSTPNYTRVAIDLGAEVTFEAARVPHPDRIFFDLHGAKLGAELVGKSFDVTDDGFLKRIRAAQAQGDMTRVVLDVNDVTEYSAFLLPNPYRLIIDIHGKKTLNETQRPAPSEAPPTAVPTATVRRASTAADVSGLPPMAPTSNQVAAQVSSPPVRPVPSTVATLKPQTTIEVAAVSDSPGKVEETSFPTSKPIAATVKKLVAAPSKAADKTAEGETSLVRALGLKINRIVIDAGHGGHDSGTLGVDGIEEKDVVLDVALRLGKLLSERLGAQIIYTRSDDTFIPLETRTAIANKAQADLFLSIHANSSPDETARGVETFYLNFTSDPTALDVAARENAVSGASVHQLSDLVKKITLKDKLAESHEFASDVEGSLYAGLTKGNEGLKNRGVKKAPFVVLIGANMPSILAEISFVTNPRDAEQLRDPAYRQRVAESLYSGVAKYEDGLAGAKPVLLKRAALK